MLPVAADERRHEGPLLEAELAPQSPALRRGGAGRELGRVDAVVDRADAPGDGREAAANLFGDAVGDAHETGVAVAPHAQPFGDALDHPDHLAVERVGPAGPSRLRGVCLVAAVDRDAVDAVRHDRAGALDDAATTAGDRERAGEREPRVCDQERAARAAHAVELDAAARGQHTFARDHRHRVTALAQPDRELGELALHAADRADVVRDDRDRHLAGGPGLSRARGGRRAAGRRAQAGCAAGGEGSWDSRRAKMRPRIAASV